MFPVLRHSVGACRSGLASRLLIAFGAVNFWLTGCAPTVHLDTELVRSSDLEFAGNAVLVDARATVSLTYRIRNVSGRSVAGWRVKTHCGCMLVSGEGVAIPPGGESLTQILVHAPAMGELRELLPIESASDAAIRFGTIPIWIRVNGDVPRVYSKPDAVQLSLYDTDEVNHEFSVVAIEPKDSEYWIASWRLEGLEQATVIVRQVDEQPDASSGALIRKYHLQLGGSVPTHSGSGGGGYSAKVIGRIDAAGAEVAAIPLQIIRRSAVRFVPQSITLSMEHPLQRVFLIQPDQEQKQFIPDLRSPELTVIPVRSTDGVAFDVKLANEYLGMSGSWDETIEFVGPASGDKLSLPVRIRGRE